MNADVQQLLAAPCLEAGPGEPARVLGVQVAIMQLLKLVVQQLEEVHLP